MADSARTLRKLRRLIVRRLYRGTHRSAPAALPLRQRLDVTGAKRSDFKLAA